MQRRASVIAGSMIRVYDAAGNVIETHAYNGNFKEA
jgi:hypothetical protein